MKSFSEYASKSNEARASSKGAGSGDQIPQSAFELLKSVASKYEGASESELIAAVLQEAKRARGSGSLSDAEIDNFASMIAPVLNQAQRKQLKELIEQIKNS